jgi:hypothetical protein
LLLPLQVFTLIHLLEVFQLLSGLRSLQDLELFIDWRYGRHQDTQRMLWQAMGPVVLLGGGIGLASLILAFVVVGRAEGKVTAEETTATYRAYRVLLHGVLALVVVFFLLGDRIVWINCLTGFAWRAWLLPYCLPAWFTALRG